MAQAAQVEIGTLAPLVEGKRALPQLSQRSLLLASLTLRNLLGFAGLYAIWQMGWLQPLLEADTTHICKVIFVLFVVGMVWSYKAAWDHGTYATNEFMISLGCAQSYASSNMTDYHADRALLADLYQQRLLKQIAPIRNMASSLVLIGLIGTIIGFIIALSGVNKNAVTDAAAVGPMVAVLLHGMAMAMFKTLTGSVLNIWLMVNYRAVEKAFHNRAIHTIEDVVVTCYGYSR